MEYLPDHPIIRNLEAAGLPDGKEPPAPVCPICGETDVSWVYKDRWGEIVGCNYCLKKRNADTEPDCFPEERNTI